jgi:hypothetical protein
LTPLRARSWKLLLDRHTQLLLPDLLGLIETTSPACTSGFNMGPELHNLPTICIGPGMDLSRSISTRSPDSTSPLLAR